MEGGRGVGCGGAVLLTVGVTASEEGAVVEVTVDLGADDEAVDIELGAD